MNNFQKIAAIIALAFTLTACTGAKEDVFNEVPTATAQPTPNPKMTEKEVKPTETEPEAPIEDLYPESEYTFALTDEETAVYEELKSQLTTDVFEGLSPISVAKIYIKCGIDGEWEAEYICHSADGLTITKDEWRSQHEEDLRRSVLESRQSLANWQFPFLDEAEVTSDGNKAVIIYHSVPGPEEEDTEIEDTYNEFHLIQNSNGIWEVRYRPHMIG